MAKRVPSKSAVFEYFTVTTDGKYYQCQCIINDDDHGEKLCDSKISSFTGPTKNAPTRASNLKRHLQRYHPKELEEVNRKDKEDRNVSTPSTSAKKEEKSSGRQSQISTFFTSEKVTVTMTSQKFKSYIIEMVVKNSVPISFFSQPAFVGLNGEMARKVGVSLERESIRRLVTEEAKYKKEELRKSLKGCFVFIKMDACTRHRVNYFAINVRFVDENDKVVTQTLAVKDTQAHHTSEYLRKLVEEVLEDFEIKKEQVLCIVTDNASNMISTIEKMNKATEESIKSWDDEENIPGTVTEVSGEPEENCNVLDDIAEASKLFTIQHMRCAVHSLQLAIRDGLKDRHAATLIGKLRQVAVAARTPKTDAILKRRAGKGAILDQATRWGSTYLMIKRLLELKTFLEDLDNQNVSLTENQWAQVKELENLLYQPYVVTKNLQSVDLTPGGFLLEWKKLIFNLNKKGGLIADGIVLSMKERESLLLNNKILLAAIYIDPMNRILLSNEQIDQGKQALNEIAYHMKGPQRLPGAETKDDACIISNVEETSSESNEELDFEAVLDKIEHSKVKRQRLDAQTIVTPVDLPKRKFQQDVLNALKEVEQYDRSSKLTVEEAISLYPEIIRDVARTASAMPTTQVSVERLFSALKIIKSDLRASMKEDLAEAILFLRTMY